MKFISEYSTLSGEILIPASKSHTIRAVAMAAMAEGRSVLHNPLHSADALAALNAARILGAKIVEEDNKWIIDGNAGQIHAAASFIDVANSGTTLRIFTALAALSRQSITFDGDSSIRTRPMKSLHSALKKLGAKVKSMEHKCPFTVTGPVRGGKTKVDGISSQFLTALLFAAPLAENDTEIEVENLNEKPYIDITLDWLRAQNIQFAQRGYDWYKVKGGQKYKAFERQIPADFSSAAFALCAAAITQSGLLIKGLDFEDHQGDKRIFDYLGSMGMQMQHEADGIRVIGGNLTGIEIDMNDTPDALPAMAVAGCFAKGVTKLKNVAQARLKECDRIRAMAVELRKMGAKIEELEDGLIIEQSELSGAEVHGYDDHRMVMALSVAGMASRGKTIIDTAESTEVTYPSFLKDMTAIGANIKEY